MSGSKQNDVNGIVCHACARHGCYCPSSMVDLPLGEKQASVDYSKSKAFETTNVKKIRKILDIYDVMCQYFKKLGLRFDRSEFLTMPDFIIDKAIGQFHVHGHKDVCYFRFSTAFIPGAGEVDGEGCERLWAVLNKISWSARTTTLAHRAEILDDHTNDSNWKKLTNIGKFQGPHITQNIIYPPAASLICHWQISASCRELTGQQFVLRGPMPDGRSRTSKAVGKRYCSGRGEENC